MKSFMENDLNVKNILLACYVFPGKGTPVHKNRPSHGIAMHISGDACYVFDDGKRLCARENEIVYLPKGSNYTVHSVDSAECYAINFELFESIDVTPFSFKAKNPFIFFQHFRQAEYFWRSKKFEYELLCKIELNNIFYRAKYQHKLGYLSKSKAKILQPAIDFIHEKYTCEKISITHLATLCGISESYFRKLFLKSEGVSPSEYIKELRISRAKELVLSELYTVSEISEMSGFKDECYFSRTFKKMTGVSPGKFKEKNY